MTELLLYTIDVKYVAYLREIDKLVPKLDENKDRRPFVGVVFDVGDINYFAPLTSYKEKFARMKSGVDFILIPHKMGAINLNNMIPAPYSCLKMVETKLCENDTEQEKKYKSLIFNQTEWCNKEENKSMILKRAERLYRLITENIAPLQLQSRCCDFAKLEISMIRYCHDRASQA